MPNSAKTPAASGPLTDKLVRAARPGEKLSDNDGSRGKGRLTLVVASNGRKDWLFRTRTGTTDHTRKLGQYPDMTLAEARSAARDFAARPETMRRAGTLDDLLKAYVESLEARGALVTAADTEGEFARSVTEAERGREARSLTTSDIAAILRRKAQTRATTRVNRLRSMLSAAFGHAAKHDYDPRKPEGSATFLLQHNPVAGTPRIAEWERVRDRVLTRAEAQAFWDRMRQLNGTAQRSAIGAFWCFVLLTGQRATQLLDAQRDGDVLVMTDTKGRGAKAKRHALPLTPLLAALWDQAAQALRDQDAAARGDKDAAARAAKLLSTVRAAASKALPDGATPVDIRRTVETVLKDAGVSREDRAELLSHGRTGVQAAHYERTDYLAPKLAALRMLEAWLFPVVLTEGGQ